MHVAPSSCCDNQKFPELPDMPWVPANPIASLTPIVVGAFLVTLELCSPLSSWTASRTVRHQCFKLAYSLPGVTSNNASLPYTPNKVDCVSAPLPLGIPGFLGNFFEKEIHCYWDPEIFCFQMKKTLWKGKTT